VPRTMSCKMRTAERINAAHSGDGVPVAMADADCAAVHMEMLSTVASGISARALKRSPIEFTIAADISTFMGPSWLEPWPFNAVTRTEGGKLQLQSRSLYVANLWWLPMPARFKGNHYCHLVAPEYLELLLRGEANL